MAKDQSITKILAAFMLGVFAFSVTPKLLLHNLIANHQDTPVKSSANPNAQLNIAGFNCGCDNLVVESPFVEHSISSDIDAPKIFSAHIVAEVNRFISVNEFYFELRGPPSLA
ncbi:MAG TPA: hypothetical protein VKR53_21690 [Puia sp.]|nr:hypothetical protein [Puia sp.]